ncbi:hypothetical protein [Moraxella lacunata]|uniref:hypothetical protein n=1 Tax=Moraxella lacunata TaxID=477 RepID=UPI003EE1E8B3
MNAILADLLPKDEKVAQTATKRQICGSFKNHLDFVKISLNLSNHLFCNEKYTQHPHQRLYRPILDFVIKTKTI